MTTLDRVLAALSAGRFLYGSEADLQQAIADVLVAEGLEVEREVRLNRHDRIDLHVGGRFAIEVKVDGSARDLARQLRRYAASDSVDALVVVTNRARHSTIPDAIDGTPVHVIWLGKGGL